MEGNQIDRGTHAAVGAVDVSRRQALARLGTLGLGAAALGALGADGIPAALAAAPESRAQASHTYRFVFVNHVTTNPFFAATRLGAQDACGLLGCTYEWTGSVNAIVSEMTSALRTAIATRADGIAVAIVDAEKFNAPIAEALDKGIPVVAYNSDAPASSNNARLAYIGQELFASGQAMGERIANSVRAGGHVLLFIATPGTLNIQPRVDGAVAALRASNKRITFEVIKSGALAGEELVTVARYVRNQPHVAGMFAVDAGSTSAIAVLSRQNGLARQGMATGGFDLLPTTISAIASGDLGFTIDQQAYQQGFYPITQLYLYKISNTLMYPSDTNTGLKFVTRANVGTYSTPSHFEGNG